MKFKNTRIYKNQSTNFDKIQFKYLNVEVATSDNIQFNVNMFDFIQFNLTKNKFKCSKIQAATFDEIKLIKSNFSKFKQPSLIKINVKIEILGKSSSQV